MKKLLLLAIASYALFSSSIYADTCRNREQTAEVVVENCDPSQGVIAEDGTEINPGCSSAHPLCYKSAGNETTSFKKNRPAKKGFTPYNNSW